MSRENLIQNRKKAVVACGLGLLVLLFAAGCTKEQNSEISVELPVDMVSADIDLVPMIEVENPIDFSTLWEEDKNVYAYLEIPGTVISYPILQSDATQPEDYYLEHNMDGSAGYPGCIYSQRCNAKDFSDAVTILYGHNMNNGSYFHELHNFRDADFFDENTTVYVYTPDEVLEYEIFAAYIFTDDHLFFLYDPFSKDGYTEYLEEMPEFAKQGCYRELNLTTDDKILTMSTCTNNPSTRLLVQACLVRRSECPAGETNEVPDISVRE